MPYSFDYYNENVKNIVRKYNIKKVFDVGCGAGKYGKILEGIAGIIDGCEPEKTYIDKLKPTGYRNIYNEYFDVPILDKIEKEGRYDLTIFGDVLEHVPHSKVFDLLDLAYYLSKYTIILTPLECPQGAVVLPNIDNNPKQTERHISFIRPLDIFQKYEVLEYHKNIIGEIPFCLYLLKGCVR